MSKQLRDHRRETQRDSKLGAARVRQQLADTDRRLKVQIQALEDDIEPDLASARIQELRDHREALTAALIDLAPAEAQDAEDDALAERLERITDLTRAFRDAPFEVKRQMLDAFDVQIAYDRAEGRIEVSAAVSDAVADALENEQALREEGLSVTVNFIAGAGFEPATLRIISLLPQSHPATWLPMPDGYKRPLARKRQTRVRGAPWLPLPHKWPPCALSEKRRWRDPNPPASEEFEL